MKKIITAFSLTAMVGLGYLGYESTKVDSLLGTETKNEKTYIVEVAGDVVGSDADKALAEKNRKQVLSELALKLDKDSYEVTYVYDTVFNGFAIKTTPENAAILEKTLNVSSVAQEHTYSMPDGSETPIRLAGSAADVIKKQKLENYSAQTMKTMVYNSDTSTYESVTPQGGKGIAVGIIDTGMYLNQVAGTSARAIAESSAVADKLNAPAFKDLASTDGMKYTETGLKTLMGTSRNYTRINNKIPFAYDYAGNDNDVDPTANGSEHGTHVASLAAANGDDFTGIAPNAQIAVMKVFGDNQGGADSSAIIAAINDAAKLGLDEINMSLGTDLLEVGPSVDGVDNATYKALKAASDKGVIANISAGNAGKSNFSSGDYSDWTTNTVESGILGSDANFDETANIVASSTPDKAFYSSIMNVQADGVASATAVSYSDQVVSSSTQKFDYNRRLTDLLVYTKAEGLTAFADGVTYYTAIEASATDHTIVGYEEVASDATFDSSKTYYTRSNSVTKDYLVIPGYGQAADYNKTVPGTDKTYGAMVNGKVAVVHRGNSTFVDKVQQAIRNGAIAVVVINNTPSTTFNFSMAFNDYSPTVPVVFALQNSSSVWGAAGTTGKINLMVDTVADAADGNTVSSFSSDGPSSNLDIGPSISAPGTLIMGAVNATDSNAITADATTTGTSGLYGYENMSGTSMAAPNLTGALAAALGEKKARMTDEEFAAEKKKISLKAMATADQLIDGTKANENSPRMQGAGRINVKSLLTADSYVTVPNEDDDGFGNTEQGKAELKNTGSLFVQDGDFSTAGDAYIEFPYTIHNDSSESKTYKASMSVMIPHLEVMTTHDAYAAEEDTSRNEEVGYSSSVTFNKDDLSTYPSFVGTPTMSVQDDTIVNYDATKLDTDATSSITVDAGQTASGTAKIRIDNLAVTKDFGDKYVANTTDGVYTGTLKDYISKFFSESAGTYVEGYLKLTEDAATPDDNETVTVPYLGFYGDYSAAEAVEPFSFEKEEMVLNGKYNSNYQFRNSDIINNYMKHLNAQYAKPNAYAGSTISATGASISQSVLNDIGNFNTSPLPDGSRFQSVTGDIPNHLYAGATGISDHLNTFFFVNRAISKATWSITDANGATKKSGTIYDLMPNASGDTMTYATISDYGLNKSWLTQESAGYGMNRGYADIVLTGIAEGEYNLNFSFTLNGAKVVDSSTKKNTTTYKTQTKSYPLTIDRTAPELISVSSTTSGTSTKLNVQAKGAENTITIGATNLVGNLVAGTDDVYETSAKLTTSAVNDDKTSITLTDFAHNTITVLVHPSDFTFMVGASFFTNRNDYFITELDPVNHLYSIEILDRNGNTVSEKDMSDYTLYIQLATGLDKNSIVISIDSVNVDDFTYDATTGILTVNMKADSGSFQINMTPGKNTVPDSSSTPDSSSAEVVKPSSNTSTNTSSEEKKGGCGGSVVVASSIVGGLSLLSAGLLLKKKREEK